MELTHASKRLKFSSTGVFILLSWKLVTAKGKCSRGKAASEFTIEKDGIMMKLVHYYIIKFDSIGLVIAGLKKGWGHMFLKL